MSCESTRRCARNADLQRSYVFTSFGQGFDLTGWSAVLNIYSAVGTSPLLTVTSASATANGSILNLLDESAGILSLLLKKADIDTLPLGSPTTSSSYLYYDLLLTSPSTATPASVTTRIIVGGFVIDPAGGGSVCCDMDQVSLDLGISSIQIEISAAVPIINAYGLTPDQLGAVAAANLPADFYESVAAYLVTSGALADFRITETG